MATNTKVSARLRPCPFFFADVDVDVDLYEFFSSYSFEVVKGSWLVRSSARTPQLAVILGPDLRRSPSVLHTKGHEKSNGQKPLQRRANGTRCRTTTTS